MESTQVSMREADDCDKCRGEENKTFLLHLLRGNNIHTFGIILGVLFEQSSFCQYLLISSVYQNSRNTIM